ncbi:aspartate/glutamate racemase family protein [Gudongella sp. DL1XJH-153]|uniref:aspartate/glutamate racemase family protein n=1 Tax=Gudongella sp. DL1XJH-153 TaxID=3409804 RepID=UPI003BB4C794
MKKTIGIIGGMGPLATVKLFEKIVLNTRADSDQDHPRTIIDSNTRIPDRTRNILSDGENPTNELIESARCLERAGADFLTMPCNTAHYFMEEVLKEVELPFIDMIKETVNTVKKEFGSSKVGIFSTDGTISSGVYTKVLQKEGIEYVLPSPQSQKAIMELIYNIKKGQYDNDLTRFFTAIDELHSQGVQTIILGCTELSVAADMYKFPDSVNYVDALVVLAREAIIGAGCDINS